MDISRDVLEMNSIVFPDPRENPLNDPRVRVHIEDGRYFLQTTDRTFDLITGEPPPPQVATVVNLYTREYFQRMYDRLNEGGFVTYWLPLHSLSDSSAKSIIKAFLEVFPDASLWHGSREDVMLVGTRNARGPVSADWFDRQWREPSIAEEMKAVGLERPEQLGALFIGDAQYLRELTRETLPLVDNFPKRILSDSPLGQGSGKLFLTLLDTEKNRDRFLASPLIERLWPEPLVERTVPYFDHQRIVNNLLELSGSPLAKSTRDLHFLLTQTTLTAPILWYHGDHLGRAAHHGDAEPGGAGPPDMAVPTRRSSLLGAQIRGSAGAAAQCGATPCALCHGETVPDLRTLPVAARRRRAPTRHRDARRAGERLALRRVVGFPGRHLQG